MAVTTLNRNTKLDLLRVCVQSDKTSYCENSGCLKTTGLSSNHGVVL